MSGVDNLDKYYEKAQNFPVKAANSYLEHLCLLDIDEEPYTVRHTGIICTIGPACREVPKMMEMIKNGLNIARLNFSHGNHEDKKKVIEKATIGIVLQGNGERT